MLLTWDRKDEEKIRSDFKILDFVKKTSSRTAGSCCPCAFHQVSEVFGLKEEEEKEMSLNIFFSIQIICKGFTWPHDCGNRRCRNCLQNFDNISFQSFSSYWCCYDADRSFKFLHCSCFWWTSNRRKCFTCWERSDSLRVNDHIKRRHCGDKKETRWSGLREKK